MMNKILISLLLLALMKPVFMNESSEGDNLPAQEQSNDGSQLEEELPEATQDDEGEPGEEEGEEGELNEDDKEDNGEDDDGEAEGDDENEEEEEEDEKNLFLCAWGKCDDQCCRLNWEGRMNCCVHHKSHCCGSDYELARKKNGGNGTEVFAHTLALSALKKGKFRNYKKALAYYLGLRDQVYQAYPQYQYPVYPVGQVVLPQVVTQLVPHVVVNTIHVPETTPPHVHEVLPNINYANHNHHAPHYVHENNINLNPLQTANHLIGAKNPHVQINQVPVTSTVVGGFPVTHTHS